MAAVKGLLKNPAFRVLADEAAKIYAAWNSSDPWAYSRIMNCFDRAWEEPGVIKADFEPRVEMRRKQIIREAEEMQRQINASA